MKRLLILVLLLFSQAIYAQDEIFISESRFVNLNDVDLDTIFFAFNKRGKTSTTDTTGSVTVKQKTVNPSAYALILDRQNVSGAADSFAVAYAPLHPSTGAILTADTTYVIGGPSAFGDFVSGKRFTITPGLCPGIAIILKQGDLTPTVENTKITAYLLRRE